MRWTARRTLFWVACIEAGAAAALLVVGGR